MENLQSIFEAQDREIEEKVEELKVKLI